MAEYKTRPATPEEVELLKKANADPWTVGTRLWYMVCFWQKDPADPWMIETRAQADPVGRDLRRTHGFNCRGRLPPTNLCKVKVRKCPGRGQDRNFEHWFISMNVGERFCSRCRGRGRHMGELPSYSVNVSRWRAL